jgi:glycosyltransferase involved in cell wall biosynthesis
VSKVVVLGMMAKIPVPGVVWQTLHYLLGFRAIGFDPYYVEAHARAPSMLMERATDDGAAIAAAFIDTSLRRFDLSGRWAYHALDGDGRCLGMSVTELRRLYREAEFIVNLHGGTEPRPELAETGKLVYLETDPVQLQIELHDGVQYSIDFLAAHRAHFTYAENLGRPPCSLPTSDRFSFSATRQPVVLDLWQDGRTHDGTVFTTVANWRQSWRSVRYEGETYGWSKHTEWAKFLGLPGQTHQPFELALSGYEPRDQLLLEEHGWRVRPALDLDLDSYHDFVVSSLAEFTVAKDQNVRFRTGWFSDRSATYLAAGRPVITQDTGFGEVLPTGEGLFAVRNLDEAAAAVEAVASDPARHSRAAAEIASEYFDAKRVLGRLVDDLGAPPRRQQSRTVARDDRRALGPDSTVLALIPHFKCEQWLDDCLASLRAQTRPLDGIVVIDDASDDPPVGIVERHPGVTLLHAAENVGPYRLIQQVIEDTDYDAYLFQDADDWSAPQRLEKLLEGASQTGAELIGSQEVRVFCDEPEAAPISWPLDGNAPFRERATAFSCLHPTSLVSRDLVMALGGFASGLRFGGDAEFLRRAHWIATVANVPYYGYYRRIRQNSLTTAPATAIGTPARRHLMEETFARANANAELVAAGHEPDLTPLRTASPVELRHLAGPPLRPSTATGHRPPRPVPTAASPTAQELGAIFVIGAERSGASALACALGEHPAISLNLHGGWIGTLAAHLEAARAEALEEDGATFGFDPPTDVELVRPLAEALGRGAAPGARHVVDPAWQHTRDVQRLAVLFPEGRFIHVVRDVHSAVRALSDPPLGSPGATGGTQVPARLRARVNESEAVERWVAAVEGCIEAERTVAQGRMLIVTHAELLADPAAVVSRCLDFVGEPYAPECLRPLRELRSLVGSTPLEPTVEPELWQRALRLNRDVGGAVAGSPRVVMVTDHFPKFSETFFVRKLLGLLRRGWDVHVVCQRSNKEHWVYFPTLREDLGDVQRIHVARGNIEATIAELQPDIVHFGYGVLAADRMHLREALGCRIVVSFRGFDLNSYRLDDPTAYKDVWDSADMLHVVSESIWHRAKARGCPPDRPHRVITDAVDVEWLQPPERAAEVVGTSTRPVRLLSVGRLHWKKGHENALAAVRALRDLGVEPSYKIVGEGDHREPTQFAIADLRLEDCVELLGALGAQEVRELLAWADVFVHPSLTEGFGVAVAEAQAMGLPVVCSDAGGLPENVAHESSGFVVPRRNPGVLAYRVFELANDPELRIRMGKAARARAESVLSLEHQLDGFEQLYRDVLAPRQSHPGVPLRDARAASRARRREALQEELATGRGEHENLRELLWRREVLERTRAYVESELPQGARVLVVSRGDEDIVDFAHQHGEHFPQEEGGVYAGHHPADSAEALEHLLTLRARGAEYLVVPGTSSWWLDYYEDFARYLDGQCARVTAADGAYTVYMLAAEARVAA